ncbi:MAG: flagellar hook-basal body protein [Phycisphaerae bacterium]|nr:flagellar hook-basal body protein [Phycisphaerae bacterium]
MNYGLYVTASGLATQMAKQDALSNNLANVNTTAYKPDVFAVRERLAARQEDGLGAIPSNSLLERLGGGVMPVAMRVNMAPSALERTGRPLDVGIEGEGFLLVRTGAGENDVGFTRDGRFTLAGDGRLISSTNGLEILDSNGSPIRLDPTAPVHIRPSGAIVQKGSDVAQLALVTVGDPSALHKAGEGVFRLPEGEAGEHLPATGRIMQEFVESSGSDPILTMNAISEAGRSVVNSTSVISYINGMMDRAINGLGRTS